MIWIAIKNHNIKLSNYCVGKGINSGKEYNTWDGPTNVNGFPNEGSETTLIIKHEW